MSHDDHRQRWAERRALKLERRMRRIQEMREMREAAREIAEYYRPRGPHARRHRKRLLHQLFLGFGVAILMSMMAAGFVMKAVSSFHGPGPWRIIVFLVAGCVLWMFSGVLAHRLAWPLWELSRAVKDFGAGKLDRRAPLPHGSPMEVAELANNFNEMASRIEALVQGQRELLGAVSHELRTPLARLRVLLAILQDSAGDAALVAKFEREILEMDQLVGELLAEARITAGSLTLRPLDLQDVIRECAERLGLELAQIKVDESTAGDPTLISRAVTILLDNAAKHGGCGIRASASVQGAMLRLCVEDEGPGFDPADLPKLFAAFARGRGAVADEKRGVGLGLYLVRRIAEAHGGSAFAENRAGGGACVGFTLPRAAPAAA